MDSDNVAATSNEKGPSKSEQKLNFKYDRETTQ